MKLEERYEHLYTETQKHISRLKGAYKHLQQVGMPLNANKVREILQGDLVAYLEQIAYRFSKVQDNLGKLVRLYLSIKGENVDNLTMIDVLNLAERYQLGIDKIKWFELRELRNTIVHEYEDRTENIAHAINKIHDQLPYLENLLKRLKL
ncbi:MAG: hypothetical protein GXO18_05570 [Aquificae bacterium]|nr:hypothetical protein [Aquificota bacterium]